MCAHAVHSEGNQCEILVVPIECTVEMALRLETAIVGTCHVVQEVRRRESHKGDTMLELVPNADHLMLVHLMLIHVKFIIGIVVPRNKLLEADGFGLTVHTAFDAVNANTRNSILHYLLPLGPNQLATAFWLLLSNGTRLQGLKFSRLA